MKLWLDLEQTIISVWDDPVICNKEKVMKFVKNHSPTEVNIFSFAVWDDKDRYHFNENMKSWLEDVFEFRINRVPTVDEMVRKIHTQKGTVFTRSEFTAIWRKEKAFIDWIVETEGAGEFILIDDAVDNITMTRHRSNKTIHILNVDWL